MNLEEVFRRMPQSKRRTVTFRLGDRVRVRSGPFASFAGRVEGINQARGLLKVVITILDRAQPLTLKFIDVEKV